MRQITLQSIAAFFSGDVLVKGNMYVAQNSGPQGPVSRMYLHGNLIAEKVGPTVDYDLTLCDACWQSNTTKDRLNGILNYIGAHVGIGQQDYQWYIGGEDWLGSVVVRVRGGVVTAIESTRPNGAVINVPLAA